MTANRWSVGEVAVLTGVTVRALHHYDHLGLLCPERDPAGHRVYGPDDIARLYRIALLRRVGLPLDRIGASIDRPDWALGAAVTRHLELERQRAATAARLAERLATMAGRLDQQPDLPPADLFATLEDMMTLDPAVRSTTSLLVYDDLAAAHRYLVSVFGLAEGPVERVESGAVVHAEVRAGDHVIWLHPAGPGYVSPRTLGGVTGMTVVAVDDVDAHHRRCVEAGVEVVEEPVDQAYGVREYGVRDLEGQLWYFHSPLGA